MQNNRMKQLVQTSS
jgi:FtsZ-binding cell division protein ZapB